MTAPSAALIASGRRLLTALDRYGFPMSDAAWRNTGDSAPVGARASVEARALHVAAVEFRNLLGATPTTEPRK